MRRTGGPRMRAAFAAYRLLLAACFVAIAQLSAANIDDASLAMPQAGDCGIHLLTPRLIEFTVVTEVAKGEAPPNLEKTVQSRDFQVTVRGTNDVPSVQVQSIGFKRRVLYAPITHHDLRDATSVYLELASALPENATVRVAMSANGLSRSALSAESATDPLRYSPAIHVNQEGYSPGMAKVARVGYYLGTRGELPIPADAGFDVVDAASGKSVYHDKLWLQKEVGSTVLPAPYQSVYAADFTRFDRPGVYRIAVAGLGASLPFRIDDGELMNATRAYALGLYHQRCGTALELPFTRFTHGACHTAPAEVPMPPGDFRKAWEIIHDLDKGSVKPEHPEWQLKTPEQQFYPFVKTGRVDVSGGHHDAGDYSKYTVDSAALIHPLIFAVDSFPGVAELDNLGLPESGDGIPDVLQEAKWEADFLAKMQDSDGGFYFLVYPKNREYETDVPPDRGDPQIVWPKTTSATAAAVAALAECSSSPAFKKAYPEVAKDYFAKALRGWAFLMRALETHGEDGAYQRLTHYGDTFADRDELAWAACEMFLATGNREYEEKLFKWFPNPSDPNTRQYGWHAASFCYGNALRSYAFASSSGRLPRGRLDRAYVAKCEAELRRAGEDAARWSAESAYGVSYPQASKRINAAGWLFASDTAFDLTVAYQLEHRRTYADAVVANLDYELGCNPVNRVFVTGLGVRRQREIVDQAAQNDDRVLPPSGIPLGAIAAAYSYLPTYSGEPGEQSWPRDDGDGPIYPMYDRWSDNYNLSTEFVIANQGRSLASLAYWAAQTPLHNQRWRAAQATITGIGDAVRAGRTVTCSLQCGDLDLSNARIVWEASGHEPVFGPTFVFRPEQAGHEWLEAEAALPDGRRVFARKEFRVHAPVVLWVNGAVPDGAETSVRGGDTWDWVTATSRPADFHDSKGGRQHESAAASGIHDHGFDHARAPLEVDPGDVLFAYVFLDPKHPPKTVMLDWNSGGDGHRAFWGENLIPWGQLGTASQYKMGALPPTGRWVRLAVPAKTVALEGKVVTGMTFRLFDGAARWDAAGKMSAAAARTPHLPLDADAAD